MKQCPTCRRTYDDTTVFCKECGVALGSVLPSPPAADSVQTNEYKEWRFVADWGFKGDKVTNIKANGPIMDIEQYKQYVFKFSHQQTTVDAREITDVHIKKNIQITAVILILWGILALFYTKSVFWPIVGIVLGAISIKNKYYVITHRRGTVTIPLFSSDSEDGKDFLNYITRYSPYAVKTDLGLGR